MREIARVVDNFYDNPDQVREYALIQDYDSYGNYPGVRTGPLPERDSTALKHKLEAILNTRITFWPDMSNTAFQYTVESDTTWIHRDDTDYAALIYLSPNPPPLSGTSLYRHRATGVCMYERDKPETDFNNCDFLSKETEHEHWDTVLEIPNVYNRLILYKGLHYHSSTTAGFGTNLENGRLFQTFFFNVEGGI